MATFEFFQAAGLSYDEVVNMAEKEVVRIDSPLFSTIESELAEMLGATVTKSLRESTHKKKRRVYVPYTVDQSRLYQLTSDYPEWDIQFTMAEKMSANMARAVFQLSIEKLFDFSGPDKARFVIFGCTLNPLVMRNRTWAHVCLPLADSAAYRDSILDDRVMQSIVSAAKGSGKTIPLTSKYEAAQMQDMSCSRPGKCEFQAKMGAMALHRTPTCFRQVCAFMAAHGTKVLYFFVPWNKAMETGVDGDFPELDAYVKHQGSYIDLAYRNAHDLDTRFDRSGYLELITRTSLKLAGSIYTKEHVEYLNGMAFYRVIATDATFDDEPPVYRSWLNPAYRDYYSIKAFVPRSNYHDLRKYGSYRELLFDVPKSLLDPLLHFGMSLDAVDNTPMAYRRKLRSLTSSVVLHSSIVRKAVDLSVDEYKALAMVAFTHVFMTKYSTGETVKTLMSDMKYKFSLQHAGAFRVMSSVVARLAFVCYDYTLNTFLSKLNTYWRALWKRGVPVGSIAQTIGFKEYVSGKPNPWTMGSFQDTLPKMVPSAFYQHLPGAAELSFLYANHVLPMPAQSQPVLSASDQDRLELDLRDAMYEATSSATLYVEEPIERRAYVESEVVDSLAHSIVSDFGKYRDTRDYQYTAIVPMIKRHPPPTVHAGKSDSVVHDLYYVLERFFPGTTLLDTGQFQSDINYGPMELVARAYKLSLDLSKLAPLRPEKIYLPKVKAHVAPHTKNTLQNTLYTVVKRNLNTPDAKDPAGISAVWERVWPAMLQVFFLPDTSEVLETLPYIGPTFEDVKEWVSKLPDDKRRRLLEEDFSLPELDMIKNEMMMKAKGKPVLGPEFAVSVKPAQSVAYDSTGKRVALFSPVIAAKVKRMQSVLKPNVLVMQYKSPADISEFLCRFDHRPDPRPRRYLELDAAMFDKSQGLMAKSMHWNLLAMFKVLPELLQMIESSGSALVASSIQAGVKIMTPPERETGQYDTLDGNTDVSMAIFAVFFASILEHIEFIMVMGDDVTLAVRGDFDTSSIEADVARIFNVSVKYTLSEFGYFCSGFIVHLLDGLSRWVPDPAKRILDYCAMSNKEETDVYDQFQSHHDLCQGLEDVVTQEFLAVAVPSRYALVSSVLDGVAVKIACKLIATVMDSFPSFQKLRSNVLSKRIA